MRRIGIVVYPNFRLIGLAAATVLEIANSLRASPFYDVRVVSEAGGLVRSSIGVSVQTEPLEQIFRQPIPA
jgi:transcriptional regulator GlxA family with amidase domain